MSAASTVTMMLLRNHRAGHIGGGHHDGGRASRNARDGYHTPCCQRKRWRTISAGRNRRVGQRVVRAGVGDGNLETDRSVWTPCRLVSVTALSPTAMGTVLTGYRTDGHSHPVFCCRPLVAVTVRCQLRRLGRRNAVVIGYQVLALQHMVSPVECYRAGIVGGDRHVGQRVACRSDKYRPTETSQVRHDIVLMPCGSRYTALICGPHPMGTRDHRLLDGRTAYAPAISVTVTVIRGHSAARPT